MKVVPLLLILISVLFNPENNQVAIAQVTSDGTTNTLVQQNGNNFTILNGIEKGNNLFHSFSNFSIPQNGSATFDLINTPNIKTIFSRVTGGKISDINGLIQTLNSNHPVSLFLINPAGIVFRENASLNIGGSFVGTTANSIKFADGVEFSATNPHTSPLLTVSLPIGLQMGQNSGLIAVEGAGHQIKNNSEIFGYPQLINNHTGLQIQANNTLALIGNKVNFSGGLVEVDGGGHLELGSVQKGEVSINPTVTGWEGNYSKVQQFNNIYLAQKSLLNASGTNGSIQLQGQNINLSDGSMVAIQNLGRQSQGITIYATESLNLIGNTSDKKLGSIIKLENLGLGRTGDIVVWANQLTLQDGGQIETGTFTPAPSGNILVNAQGLIDLNGFVPGNPSIPSSIATLTLNSGNAGDINVSSANLKIRNGGSLSSLTVSSGQAARVHIDVKDSIEIAGNNPMTLTPSTITSTTLSTGNAADVVVTTSRLVIRDGGTLGSVSVNQGSSGKVTVNALDLIEVSGRAPGSIASSRIASTSEITDAVVQAIYGVPLIPTGDASALTINTPLLSITNGAQVTVKTDGPGNAGDLQINSNSIFLDNQGTISASTISGNGGNIKLNLQDNLLMRHNSLIAANAGGQGNGGNLSIHASVIVGLENSDIIANAFQGQGGNVQITTQGIFGLELRPQLTAKSDITVSSIFGLNGGVEIKTLAVDPSKGIVALPVEPKDVSSLITQGCGQKQPSEFNRFIVTGQGGLPQNPEVALESDTVLEDIQTLPVAIKSDRSLVTPSSENLPLQTSQRIVEAQGLIITPQGEILLTAQSPVTTPHSSGFNPTSCLTN
ncbi:filamentous hemagglutinin family outer membrane protein [Calothrix brevissima NIES-22]|nr:filamentous hemagglutinin family outer membrane protein [Calothrix brevissima NIES-22]